MIENSTPFGQDRSTQLADANKMIRIGVIALLVSIGLTAISSRVGNVVVVSPVLFVIGLGSLIAGLAKRSKATR